MAGLSDTGLTIKRLSEIITSLKNRAATEFSGFLTTGDALDTSDNSVLGRMINIIAEPISDLWETTQEVHNAFSLNATGVALEQVCALGGVIRKTTTPSQALLVSRGTYGITIPTGSFVRSANTNKVFEFQEDVTLDENKAVAIQVTPTTVLNSTAYSFTYQVAGVNNSPVSVSYTSGVSATTSSIINGLITEINTNHNTYIEALLVDSQLQVQVTNQDFNCDFASLSQFTIVKAKKSTLARCTENGINLQDADTIQTIQSPLVGWATVTNPFAAIAGTLDETDSELRLRYLQAKFGDGSNTYEAIYSSILKIDGVKQVVIYENETDTAFVSPAVPPHSFYPIVLGGIGQEIANAIWNNKPAGILSYGTETFDVEDSQGVLHSISFDRPTNKEIYISLDISKDSTFPADGVDLITQSLITFFSTFSIGQDVIYSRLYTPINNAANGFYVDSLVIGDAPSPSGTANIPVDFNEIVNISASNIIISFV